MGKAGGRKEPFRFLEHTADAKFQAFGGSLEEAFSHAAHALLSLMWDRESVSPLDRRPVRVEGRDEPQLLVGFLEEILFLWEARSFLVGDVEGLRIESRREGGYVLTALFTGQEYRGDQDIHGEVKAVTYHDMVIRRAAGGGVMIQVVVDI
jgi:SHS2 domain-containing protein